MNKRKRGSEEARHERYGLKSHPSPDQSANSGWGWGYIGRYQPRWDMLASLDDGGGGDGGGGDGDGDGGGDGARDRGVDSKISPPWRRTTLLWASAVAGQLASWL